MTFGRLAIDRDGRFVYDGTAVTHPGIVDLLFAHLRPARQGLFEVEIGPVRVSVAIEDTPYVVIRVGDGEPVDLTLQDGSREPLDPTTLVVGSQGALYCRVRGGVAEARFARGPHHALGSRLTETPDGGFALVLAGREFRVGDRLARGG